MEMGHILCVGLRFFVSQDGTGWPQRGGSLGVCARESTGVAVRATAGCAASGGGWKNNSGDKGDQRKDYRPPAIYHSTRQSISTWTCLVTLPPASVRSWSTNSVCASCFFLAIFFFQTVVKPCSVFHNHRLNDWAQMKISAT